MNNSTPSHSPTGQVLYPAQGIITLLSRAWNLFRINFKTSILILLPAVLLFTLIHLLSSQLSGGTVLTRVTLSDLGWRLFLALAVMGLSIPSGFLWMFSACALSRFYYSAISGEKPLPIKACLKFVAQKWLTLTLMTLVLGVAFFILLIFNFVILYLGIILSGILLGYLGVSAGHALGQNNSVITAVMVVLFLIVWGFIILALLIVMFTCQIFFFAFPLLAISNCLAPNLPWWPLVQNAYRLALANAPRLLLFSLALFFLSSAISAVINSPVIIWAGIEFARLGLSRPFQIPVHIQTVINLWSTIASLILVPFHISAFTLLWYDCQVRKEGLDLVLWFNRMLRRQGRQPQEFSTGVEPQ